jgi:hypothetical protein
MIIGILIYIGVLNTFGMLFALYGYGSAKGWWK